MPQTLSRKTPPKRPKTTRRGFLTAAGAFLIGTGLSTDAMRSLHQQLSPKHEVHYALALHEKPQDLQLLDDLITREKALGQPFDAIGQESAFSKPGEMRQYLQKNARLQQQANQLYAKHSAQGKQQALQKVRQFLNQRLKDPWHAQLHYIAFKHQLPMVPIEEYTQQELNELTTLYNAHQEQLEQALNLPTLQQQLQPTHRAHWLLANHLNQRNQRITQATDHAAALLKQQYPHLAQKQALKLAYTLGIGHTNLPTTRTTTTNESTANQRHYPTPPLDIQAKLNANPDAQLTQTEKARLVIENNLANHLSQLNNQQKLQQLAQKIRNTTLADFQTLNKLTTNQNPQQKQQTILKYLKNKK